MYKAWGLFTRGLCFGATCGYMRTDTTSSRTITAPKLRRYIQPHTKSPNAIITDTPLSASMNVSRECWCGARLDFNIDVIIPSGEIVVFIDNASGHTDEHTAITCAQVVSCKGMTLSHCIYPTFSVSHSQFTHVDYRPGMMVGPVELKVVAVGMS